MPSLRFSAFLILLFWMYGCTPQLGGIHDFQQSSDGFISSKDTLNAKSAQADSNRGLLPSKYEGVIVFEFIIDAKGNPINIKTIKSTASSRQEKYYRKQLEETIFTSNAGKSRASTIGTVTFRIKREK